MDARRPPARDAQAHRLRAGRPRSAALARRRGPRRQPLALGRSVHARADERREELCRALPDRRTDGRWRDRRGGRIARPRPRARRPRTAHARLARRGGAGCEGSAEAAPARRSAPGVPGPARHAGHDRVVRPARGGGGAGRRHRLRFRRRRRGRLDGGADRQGARHDRDRLGGRRRQGRVGPRTRRRPRDRLQGRTGRRRWPRPPPRGSTCISTMSAGTISTPRSPMPVRALGSRSAG